jgi:hypothetical protein
MVFIEGERVYRAALQCHHAGDLSALEKVVETATAAIGRRPYRAVAGGDTPSTVAVPPQILKFNCFLKLLSNLYNNLKIFQCMKSSEFQALQIWY